MIARVLPVLALILLAGCASDEHAFADRNMMLDSEDCREHAQADALATNVANGQSFHARQIVFDQSYGACMAAKGMPIKPAG